MRQSALSFTTWKGWPFAKQPKRWPLSEAILQPVDLTQAASGLLRSNDEEKEGARWT